MNVKTFARIGFLVAATVAIGLPLQGGAADFIIISAKGVESPPGLKRDGELANGDRVKLAAGGLLIVREQRGCRLSHVFSGEVDAVLRTSSSAECGAAKDFEDVQERILSGEPLAERVVFRADGKADGFLSAVANDPCLNLPQMSEEAGRNSRRCATGYLLSGIECSGSYCDNKRLKCCPYLSGSPDPSARNYLGQWISEETGAGRSNQYSTTDFINGLSCKGDYCDDILPHAVRSTRFRNTGACHWTRYFSEEPPSKESCPAGSFIAGMRCKGSYCDDLSLQCCRLQVQ